MWLVIQHSTFWIGMVNVWIKSKKSSFSFVKTKQFYSKMYSASIVWSKNLFLLKWRPPLTKIIYLEIIAPILYTVMKQFKWCFLVIKGGRFEYFIILWYIPNLFEINKYTL